MMCSFPCRRTSDERNVGNLEGRSLGGRGISSRRGTGRCSGLLVRASSGVGGQYASARAGEAGAEGGTAHPGGVPDERMESTVAGKLVGGAQGGGSDP